MWVHCGFPLNTKVAYKSMYVLVGLLCEMNPWWPRWSYPKLNDKWRLVDLEESKKSLRAFSLTSHDSFYKESILTSHCHPNWGQSEGPRAGSLCHLSSQSLQVSLLICQQNYSEDIGGLRPEDQSWMWIRNSKKVPSMQSGVRSRETAAPTKPVTLVSLFPFLSSRTGRVLETLI